MCFVHGYIQVPMFELPLSLHIPSTLTILIMQCIIFVFIVYIFLTYIRQLLRSIMAPIWLLITLSGLVVTTVFSQNGDPPPRPTKGAFLIVNIGKLK